MDVEQKTSQECKEARPSIAANQDTGFTENALISINGQYFINNLPAGEYIVMVAYPDGTNDIVNEYQIESGSDQELDFTY